MGRRSWRDVQRDSERSTRKQLNPIWRGVGCLFAVIVAIGGYIVAEWFLLQNQAANWLPIPSQILYFPALPWLPRGIVVKIAVGAVFMILAFGIINMVYAVLFPIQPGETDAPTLKRNMRRR
jgi:hypothetical protein